ncbi:OTUD3 [Mytilus edulis]|uniref:OTUD3 n=1 Tax=Mytilus edulis TaxID=6550 RepID=A0A8S3T413_MYTED|nr:OTUD3 [Mytilus edulis]
MTDDDTYKPTKEEDIYSFDSISDAESIQNIKMMKKQRKRNYLNKDWKRKGKTLKHIQSKKRNIVPVVKNKKNRSGPWTLQDKQPITSNSQSDQGFQVLSKEAENRGKQTSGGAISYYQTEQSLLSNNLKRVQIAADGNCVLKAVLHGLQEGNSELNVEKMRKDLVEHIQHERAHYNNFLSFDEQLSEKEQTKRYDDYLHDLSNNGHWNSVLADMMHLALSNMYRHPIRVYSSKVTNSMYDILPDLGEYSTSTDFIKDIMHFNKFYKNDRTDNENRDRSCNPRNSRRTIDVTQKNILSMRNCNASTKAESPTESDKIENNIQRTNLPSNTMSNSTNSASKLTPQMINATSGPCTQA